MNVSYWGAWGTAVNTIKKYCPTDGNKDLIAYCNADPNQSGKDAGGTYFLLSVPQNQGIFVFNGTSSSLIARTLDSSGFTDFIYWTYSGKPPGSSGDAEDAEPPRWRASAFTAIKSDAVAFKGLKSTVDGLYVKRTGPYALITASDTTMDGQSVDPSAPAGSLVSAIGVERDGFRGRWLSITASMLNATTTASWAGIYTHDCGSNCATW